LIKNGDDIKMELKKEMMELDINEIRMNPHQPRHIFDEGKIIVLADSIKEFGLNTPIQLSWCEGKDGKKATLKDGERRIRAMKIAGLKKLKYGKEYIISDEENEDLEVGGLIACCMREDLQPVEKGYALLKLLKRRGLTNLDMSINAVNRAKDYVDNNFLSEPSQRNFFVSKETIMQVAKDMKMIGVSGTNAVDLLKITKLPKDIQNKVIFAPPNTKIYKEKLKMSRQGKLVKRKGNDRGELIPISFARDLVRLDNEKILRFFLRTAINRQWNSRKLTWMVNDYLGSNLTPERYIEAYNNGCKQSVRANQCKEKELTQLISTIDSMTSTLTSWRTINLVAIADAFKQKEFAISSKGLLSATTKLKQALESVLLTTVELSKVKEEERQVINLPFRVTLGTTPKMKAKAFRFTMPKELGEKAGVEVGDTVEMQLKAVIKPINEEKER
jgi:ParB/RepB/Spo0J family partition protein